MTTSKAEEIVPRKQRIIKAGNSHKIRLQALMDHDTCKEMYTGMISDIDRILGK